MKTYLVIDLKTFYASVECVERGLDPFKTNLVVADKDRCTTTVCLAITPKMKAMGIKNRCRLFEIPKGIDYIAAKPRMSKYIEYSANIYAIYLKYISKEDIYVYSVDEAFLDITNYMSMYQMTAFEIAKMIMKDIFDTTKLTSACGIGSNMYLAKIALDIEAKKSSENIGYLDEKLFIEKYSKHEPLSDFWQIGRGICERLNKMGIMNMEDIRNTKEELLYKEFGVNALLLIDHAKGIEPCTIDDIKSYKPKHTSLTSGQILACGYTKRSSVTVLKEMVELLCLELVDRNLVCGGVSLSFGYVDKSPMTGGSVKMSLLTSSYQLIIPYVLELFNKHCVPLKEIRKINLGFYDCKDEDYEIYDLFTDVEKIKKEKALNKQINMLKAKYGKNAILKGMDLEENATTIARNKLIGGHNAE